MRHEALPQNLTVERLAQWLADNSIDSKTHIEDEPYTDEEIRVFEHKSSLASRSLDKLADLEKDFKERIKEGVEDPTSITIPPTKGSKVLTANRKYADEQISLGFTRREIDLYGIPHNETEKIVFFDAEGVIWDDYSENMSKEQVHQYVGFFKKEEVEETVENDTDLAADADVEQPDKEPSQEQDSQLSIETISLDEQPQSGAF